MINDDRNTILGICLAAVRNIPGSATTEAVAAKEAAEAAQAAAEAAADTVTPATVAETKTYLGIN